MGTVREQQVIVEAGGLHGRKYGIYDGFRQATSSRPSSQGTRLPWQGVSALCALVNVDHAHDT